MAVLNSLSIRFKILLIVGIAVLGFVINFIFNYSVTSTNSVRLNNVRDVYFPILEKVDTNRVRLNAIKETLKAAVSSEDEDMLEDADDISRKMQTAFVEIGKLDLQGDEKSKNLNQLFKSYYHVARAFALASLEGKLVASEVKSTIDNMLNKMKAFDQDLEDFRKMKYQRFIGELDEANQSSEFALYVGFIISVSVIILVLFIGYFISGMIAKNISQVVASLKEMASGEGDLTHRLETKSSDEIGALVKQFNLFVEKLHHIISNINNSTIQLANAAEEMSLVSAESNENMSRQTMETEQVATAMNEMTATVQEVTNSAQAAAGSAVEASAEANNGQEIVGKTVTAINTLASEVERAATVIEKLEKDTENIGGVLDVIRGISEQTNLLALNAAIEAARAGEQGRGFAVVADEVRTLAGRTQESTTEIQSMIESLQNGAAEAVSVMNHGQIKAKDSVEQAAQAGGALQAINNAVSSIRDMNTHIASAAEEQAGVAEEINRNIHTINEIGMQTAQSAQQTASASQEISTLASALQTEVGQFKI